MEMTKKQQKELKDLQRFIPSNCIWGTEKEGDVAKYFSWSERGIPHNINMYSDRSYLSALLWAKSRRELHHAMWEDGIKEGTFTRQELYGSN